MYAPWLANSARIIIGSNGAPLSIDSNGLALVQEEDYMIMLRLGFTAITEPNCRRTVASNNANCTLSANAMAYGKQIFLFVSGAGAITANTETAANIIAVLPNPKVWDTWMARVININSGNLTLAAGNNVAFNGTSVIAANRFIDFMAQLIDDPTGGNAVGRLVYNNVGFGNAT